MASIQTSQDIIRHWKEKGESETILANRFICYWIALNAWYGSNISITPLNWKDVTERNYIDEIKKMLSQDISRNWDVEIQSAQSLTPKLKNTTRKNQEIAVSDIPTLIEFVYTVRNNLFHGNKTDTDKRDKEVLTIATPILKDILSYFVR